MEQLASKASLVNKLPKFSFIGNRNEPLSKQRSKILGFENNGDDNQSEKQ